MKLKVYARLKDNIWAADLAEMGSLSLFNCGFKYLFKRVLLEESAKSFHLIWVMKVLFLDFEKITQKSCL